MLDNGLKLKSTSSSLGSRSLTERCTCSRLTCGVSLLHKTKHYFLHVVSPWSKTRTRPITSAKMWISEFSSCLFSCEQQRLITPFNSLWTAVRKFKGCSCLKSSSLCCDPLSGWAGSWSDIMGWCYKVLIYSAHDILLQFISLPNIRSL